MALMLQRQEKINLRIFITDQKDTIICDISTA